MHLLFIGSIGRVDMFNLQAPNTSLPLTSLLQHLSCTCPDNTDDNATAMALVVTIARGWICDLKIMT